MAHGRYDNRFFIVSWSHRQKAIPSMMERGSIIQCKVHTFYFRDINEWLGLGKSIIEVNQEIGTITAVDISALTSDLWKITGSSLDDDRIYSILPLPARLEYKPRG